MPAWGFYPNKGSYGGSKSLGVAAAWIPGAKAEHVLTWVVNFPIGGTYHVWIRQYGGYGRVRVSVDERLVTEGWGGAGGGHYVWKHNGKQTISAGIHHVDINVLRGMFDAILFSLDGSFDPRKNKLPRPVSTPVLRALRTYRDDSVLGNKGGVHGFAVGSVQPYAELLYDWLPRQTEIIGCLRLWGAPNQYITGSFAVRALEKANEFKVFLSELVGPNNTKIDKNKIDLRVVHIRKRRIDLFELNHPATVVPELLLRDDRTELPPKGKQGGFGGGGCVTRIPSHESRQFWLTIHIPPDSGAGVYKGNILLSVTGSRKRNLSLPVEVEVFPIDLKKAEGYYSIFYPAQPNNSQRSKYVTPNRYFAELKDQVRHGLNSTTLYGGFSTLLFAREAGMTKPPCIMHWPDSRASNWINEAKKNGLGGLLFYGVDEPTTTAAIERCRKEAERRRKLGLSMMTAINSREAQSATREVIDHPVYNIYVFSGKNNDAVIYALKKGFKPVSYWGTGTAFPLLYRALTGLYNRACGYLGSMPWSYQDVTDNGLYDPHKTIHKVTYPDEYGEPIPTLCWEAHRAGIDDVRYLEALDRAIAMAQKHLSESDTHRELAHAVAEAQKVRRKYFESIEGRWFEYLCSLKPGNLDVARRAFADAIVAINQCLGKKRD